MDIEEYFSAIESSDPSQWLNNQNIYLTSIGQVSGGGAPHPWLEAEGPHSLYVFKPNISISVAMGRTHRDHFKEGWVTAFPDPTPGSGWVDFLYQGQLIHSDIYVAVDGGRCALPGFGDHNKTVSARYNRILRILHGISGASYDYDEYFIRSGAVSQEDRWPSRG